MLTAPSLGAAAGRRGFWRAYLVTARPYLCFVSGAIGLAGLATGPLPASRLALALGAFLASYGFGQALTDVDQTDTDALSSPYRPLVRGEIEPFQVLLVSLGGLLACGLALAWLSLWNLLLAGLGVAGLVAYTPLKRRWWAGPAWNSLVVALLALMGLFSAAGPALGHPKLWPLLGSAFFSYAVFVLLGYLKDVEADRATGYHTLPVRFGRRVTVRVSGIAALLSVTCSSVLVSTELLHGSGAARLGAALLWATGAGLLLLAHRPALRVERDDEAHRAIACSLRGLVLLHLGEAALLRPSLLGLSVALAALFELALWRRPCRSQI